LVLPLLSGHLRQQVPSVDLSNDSQDKRQGRGMKKDCVSTVMKSMSQASFSRPQLFMMVDMQPNEEENDVDMDIESIEEAIP